MKDQIVMGKNGEVAIAVPLFRMQESEEIVNLTGYSMMLTSNKPIAYVLDMGSGGTCPIVNAEIVEKQCEFLGPL